MPRRAGHGVPVSGGTLAALSVSALDITGARRESIDDVFNEHSIDAIANSDSRLEGGAPEPSPKRDAWPDVSA
jgi:hypothetical protein